MNLDERQIMRAHNFFKHLKATNEELLENKGVVICLECEGTGLGGLTKLNGPGGYSWDPLQYCDKCHGVGFRGLRNFKSIDDKHFICGECNGVGCNECKQTGFTDWIAHAMGR